jgi:hypothetical protein
LSELAHSERLELGHLIKKMMPATRLSATHRTHGAKPAQPRYNLAHA